MDINSLIDSRKGTGLIIGLIAGLLASAAAVAVGPSAIAVLPQVLLFIGSITGVHQAAQTVQDVAKANNPCPPAEPPKVQ